MHAVSAPYEEGELLSTKTAREERGKEVKGKEENGERTQTERKRERIKRKKDRGVPPQRNIIQH